MSEGKSKRNGDERVSTVEKWKDLDERDKQIAQQKTELEARVESLKERRRQLTIHEAEFDEYKKRYAKSLRDVEMRRDRALTVAAQEQQQLYLKNEEITALKAEVRKLMAERDSMLQEYRQGEMQQFLETLIESSNGEFKQAKEIISKYGLLKNIKEELEIKKMEIDKYIVDEKRNVQVTVEKLKSEIVDLGVRKSQLEGEIEVALLEEDRGRLELAEKISLDTCHQVEAERRKRAIMNLTTNIDRTVNDDADDPINRLNAVQKFIEDLYFTIAELRTD